MLTVVAAVKRGTVKYDAESARVCLDAFTTDCADLVEPAACDNVFRGTVPAGGACVTGAECVDGGRCLEPDTCTVACCVGTCEAVGAPIAIGGACDFPSSSTPCVDGAFCANDRTCTARRPVGAACQGAPGRVPRSGGVPLSSRRLGRDLHGDLHRAGGGVRSGRELRLRPRRRDLQRHHLAVHETRVAGRRLPDLAKTASATPTATRRPEPARRSPALGQACDASAGVVVRRRARLPERGLRGAGARGGLRP